VAARGERIQDEVATVNPVRAAGGVVWRPTAEGVRVCLVHRPRYDDWSLPKGKLEPGEHPLVAAVREVAEEAGVRGVPQVRLPGTSYLTRDGLPKVVEYWSMLADGDGGFQPDTEVDGIRWLTVDEAAELVSYSHDAKVLRDFAALPPVDNVLGLVRHATAGGRATWTGPDTARELDDEGWTQARALAPVLAALRPRRLLAASVRRCVQTLVPVAELLDLPIEVDSRFDEPQGGQDPREKALAAASLLAELAGAGGPAVVCGQGRVIPPALDCLAAAALAPIGDAVGGDAETAKGGGWLLAFTADQMIAAERL
jgi:8-oxo-dGTP diphosphatase